MRSYIEGTGTVTGCSVPILIVKSVRNSTTGKMNNVIHEPYVKVLSKVSRKGKDMNRLVRIAVWNNGKGDLDGLNRHLVERGVVS